MSPPIFVSWDQYSSLFLAIQRKSKILFLVLFLHYFFCVNFMSNFLSTLKSASPFLSTFLSAVIFLVLFRVLFFHFRETQTFKPFSSSNHQHCKYPQPSWFLYIGCQAPPPMAAIGSQLQDFTDVMILTKVNVGKPPKGEICITRLNSFFSWHWNILLQLHIQWLG